MRKVTLFCFPYAGGNRYSYKKFEEYVPPFLNIVPLEYPGRGVRICEPLLTDIESITLDIYNKVILQIKEFEYFFYGHSMGGLLAYQVARKLAENNYKAPAHIFITGAEGPFAQCRRTKKWHLLGKKEFIDEIKKLEGIPKEVLQNEELLSYYEPILRADFQATENFEYKENPPLNISLTVITGTEESFAYENIRIWQKETVSKVDFKSLPGKHFFIFNYTYELIKIISKKIINTINI